MKKIDVVKSYEKVKVSLALDKEVIDLIDDSLFGFKLINLFANNDASGYSVLSQKYETQFKSILNRSEFISRILSVISDENIFVVNGVEYSLNEFAKLSKDIPFVSLFDFYFDIVKLFSILNLNDLISEEKSLEIKDMSVSETIDFLRFGNDQIRDNIKKIKSKNPSKLTTADFGFERENLHILNDMILSRISKDQYWEISRTNLFGVSENEPNGVGIVDILVNAIREESLNLFKDVKTKLQDIIEEVKDDNISNTNYHDLNKRLDPLSLMNERYYQSWKANSIVIKKLDSVIVEIVKQLELKPTESIKVKVLRNHLFGETNTEYLHVFNTYVENKFRLKKRHNISGGEEDE